MVPSFVGDLHVHRRVGSHLIRMFPKLGLTSLGEFGRTRQRP